MPKTMARRSARDRSGRAEARRVPTGTSSSRPSSGKPSGRSSEKSSSGADRAAAQPKYFYSFGRGEAEGSSALRDLLGGKGCELAEMTSLGIPVPPGFTITTEAWAAYHASDKKHPPGLWNQIETGLARLERPA